MNTAPDILHRIVLAGLGVLLLVSAGHAQVATVSNQVCTKADWKAVPFFGAVSISAFQPQTLSISSPYYRGPVIHRIIPTGTLLVIAIILLLVFIIWRLLRCCCQCCCRCCCVRPHPNPEAVLAGRKMLVLRALVVLLSAGVIASCAYGMSQVEPQLVPNGIALLNSLQAYGNSVFAVIYGVLGDVGSVVGLLGQVQTILSVDVNVTDVSADITCISGFVQNLDPAMALLGLQSLQNDVGNVTLAIPTLSTNYSQLLGTEAPAYQSSAAPLAASPAFFANYSAQAGALITAVNNLPVGYPGGVNAQTSAVGNALQKLSLPLSGSKHAFLQSLEASLQAIYAAQPADLATLGDISSAIGTLSAADTDLGVMAPALASELTGAYDNYTTARPCMIGLLARLDNINSTVVTPAQELQGIQAALDAVLLNGTSPVPALAAELGALPTGALANMSNPNAAGGPVQYLQNLDTANQGASSTVDGCSTAYQTFAATPSSGTYTTLQTNCDNAVNAITPIKTGIDNSNTGPGVAFTAAASAAAQTAASFATLPSNMSVQGALSSMQATLSALPDLSALAVELAPAVAAFAALDPTTFSDLQSQLASLDTSIAQAISNANDTVSQEVDSFTSEANSIHNQTLDMISSYAAQYEPTVHYYDRIRQAVEYVYFTLAIVACLGLAFAVLTHCQFAASFFTALLLILIVLFTLVAIILYAIASIGNDGCTNAEAYLINEIPALVSDPSTQNKTLTAIDYYLFNQGGGVPALAEALAGVNLTDFFVQVNKTRDQAIQDIEGSSTLQPQMLAIVNGLSGVADSVIGRINTAEQLASYSSIHPLYIQAKTFLCCSVINMLGNLWLASFAIGSIAVFLLMTMFAYIAQLDKLPPKACCGCTCRSAREFSHKETDMQKQTSLYMSPLSYPELGSDPNAHTMTVTVRLDDPETLSKTPPHQHFEVDGSGDSRGGLIRPGSNKARSSPPLTKTSSSRS